MRLGGADLVNSVVICHPGPFTINQVKAIKVPTAWVCAEGIYNLEDPTLLKISFLQTNNSHRGHVFSRITPPGF